MTGMRCGRCADKLGSHPFMGPCSEHGCGCREFTWPPTPVKTAPKPRAWNMGDEIPADVLSVTDYTDGDCASCDPSWGRTFNSPDEWKGYKDGGSSYLSTAELLRRWGPVTEVPS